MSTAKLPLLFADDLHEEPPQFAMVCYRKLGLLLFPATSDLRFAYNRVRFEDQHLVIPLILLLRFWLISAACLAAWTRIAESLGTCNDRVDLGLVSLPGVDRLEESDG